MSDSFPKGSGLEVVSVNITIINRRCTHINTSLHDTIYYQKSIPHDKWLFQSYYVKLVRYLVSL